MDLKPTVALLLLLGLCSAHLSNVHGADGSSGETTGKESMTSTILRMNKGSSEFLEEGDIVLPKRRTAMKCKNKAYSCLWPKSANGNVEVPYLISDKYDQTERSTILHALKDFHSKTCIRFVPRSTQRAYLSIEPKYGCFSLLGSVGDKQVLSLQRYGCTSHGIIQHEVLHALGFYHEHTRSDRDQYVKIRWENIKEYYVKNFKKMDTDNLNTPYDYTSIMHYDRTAFGTLGAETIIPIPDASAPIGQREGMSETDILRVNTLYKCWNYRG